MLGASGIEAFYEQNQERCDKPDSVDNGQASGHAPDGGNRRKVGGDDFEHLQHEPLHDYNESEYDDRQGQLQAEAIFITECEQGDDCKT